MIIILQALHHIIIEEIPFLLCWLNGHSFANFASSHRHEW